MSKNASGVRRPMQELAPHECTDEQLTGFLRHKGLKIPKSRDKKIRYVQLALAGAGRTYVLVQPEPTPSKVKTMVSRLNIFSGNNMFSKKSEDEPVYESVAPPTITPRYRL